MRYAGSGLTPLFHSEITSSYMLYDIFKDHVSIAAGLINKYFGVHTENMRANMSRGSQGDVWFAIHIEIIYYFESILRNHVLNVDYYANKYLVVSLVSCS